MQPEAKPQAPVAALPRELLGYILKLVSFEDRVRAQQVCKAWWMELATPQVPKQLASYQTFILPAELLPNQRWLAQHHHESC